MRFLKLREIFAKKDVILESTSSLIRVSLFLTKPNKVGSKVNVIINEVIRPKVIIQPKPIIGFISLKIKDRKAIMVVNAV